MKVNQRPIEPASAASVDWLSALILLFGFALSRILYFQLGLRFDAEPLNYYIQYIDPLLLKTKLLESVYYLHGQPPLFNLFLGVVLKLFPNSYPAAFTILYLAVGVALMFALFRLMLYGGVKKWIALLLSLLFAALPSTALYENWLFYSYPVALLFCVIAIQLCRLQISHSRKDAFVFFSLLAVLILTRGIFNLLWFLFCVLAVLFYSPGRRKMILSGAFLPFVLLLGYQVKQELLFGATAGYSYLGTNLLCRVMPELSDVEKDELVASKKISPAVFPRVQRKISDYQQWLPPYQPTGIDVLDQEFKSTGAINLNHADYLPLSQLYLDSVKEILKAHPTTYLRSVLRLSSQYFLPSWDVFGPISLPGFTQIMDLLVRWSGTSSLESLNLGISHCLMLLLPFLILFGMYRFFCLEPDQANHDLIRPLLSFMIGNIFYVSLFTSLISYGDFNRYRFKLDPFYVVLLGMFLSSVISSLRKSPPSQDLESEEE